MSHPDRPDDRVYGPHPAGPGATACTQLHASLAPFGRDLAALGVPPCLTADGWALQGLLCRIGQGQAAGLRLGGPAGAVVVLTNRHVYEALGGERRAAAFAGHRPLPRGHGFGARAVPGPLPGGALVMPWYFGRYADWAMLDEPRGRPGPQASPGWRSAATLAAGEPLWIVGGSLDGTHDLVSVGRLHALAGVNGMLRECDVRPGMSGAPVLDQAGRVAGLFSVQFGWPGRRAMFVTIDAIAAGLAELRRLDPDLPDLAVAAPG